MELIKIEMILFKIINGFSSIKKHLENYEYIHTDHLALGKMKQSLRLCRKALIGGLVSDAYL